MADVEIKNVFMKRLKEACLTRDVESIESIRKVLTDQHYDKLSVTDIAFILSAKPISDEQKDSMKKELVSRLHNSVGNFVDESNGDNFARVVRFLNEIFFLQGVSGHG